MALHYIFPVKSGRLKPKLYCDRAFLPFWLIPLRRWLLAVFHIPCTQTDRETGNLDDVVTLSRFLLISFCWPMLLVKCSVHLGRSSQGPQITGQLTKCWPDLLRGFLAAHGGISFALACLNCYGLTYFFFKENILAGWPAVNQTSWCLPATSTWTGCIYRCGKRRREAGVTKQLTACSIDREWNL